MLAISKDLSLPDEAITQTFSLLAKRGSGKTYAAAVLMEEMIGAGHPVVALDPVGVLWGLRSSAGGKREGLPVVILGGEHGDVPLESTAGKVIADWIVQDRRPAVLDLSLFRKAEQRRFVEDFAVELYRRNREPLHVVIDEADAFAPQRPMPGEQAMLGAIEDLVRRGRARGLGVTLISQRPAVLHKDVLTQTEVLVALRMTGPQDRDAVDAWIKHHGSDAERKQVLASLGSLPIGTAWFWSPGWLGVLKRVQIRKRKTFDSSSTPAVGSKRIEPTKLAAVDLDVLRGRISETVEKAKQDDPKELRKRIVELEKQLAHRDVKPEIKTVEVPVFDSEGFGVFRDTVLAGAREVSQAMAILHSKITLAAAEYSKRCASAAALGERSVSRMGDKPLNPPNRQPVSESVNRPAKVSTAGATKLGAGERAILTAIAQHADGGVTREQLTVLTGYKRSSRDTYLQRLFAAVLIFRSGDRILASGAGRDELGPDFEPLPTGKALREHWLERLPEGERRILELLIRAYPEGVHRTALDASTGYKRSSRDTYLQRLTARRLVIAAPGGLVTTAEELFA